MSSGASASIRTLPGDDDDELQQTGVSRLREEVVTCDSDMSAEAKTRHQGNHTAFRDLDWIPQTSASKRTAAGSTISSLTVCSSWHSIFVMRACVRGWVALRKGHGNAAEGYLLRRIDHNWVLASAGLSV